jgi:PPK2 family polyphosphate:nucleotide phosphotransferase
MIGPMTSFRKLLRAPQPVDLAAIDPRGTPGLPDEATAAREPKAWSVGQLARLGPELAGLQERLYASTQDGSDRRRLLIVLQAMDAGGKDGLVRHVGGVFNPLGLRVTSFKAPTKEELQHDFLWRIRKALPEPGHVAVFNRSHYEDVLIVRVHDLVSQDVWRPRYDIINQFERELVDDGVLLVKIMLHISRDEQRKRLGERLEDPTKYWKYNPADVDERARWDDYQVAYAEALTRCAAAAPWYVVPADRKWYRNWAVASLLKEILDAEKLEYPPSSFDVKAEKARLKKA